MKKKFLLCVPVLLLVLISCKDEKKTNSGPGKEPRTLVDSLMTEVMDGHDVGMAKMGKIRGMQKEVNRMLDSINTLPAKAKEAAAPLRDKLNTLGNDLRAAEQAMNTWMDEFNMDSAVNDINKRIQYLANEKIKVSRVKEAILSSLQKADSVIRVKF